MVDKVPLQREQLAVLTTLALLTVAAWALTLVQMQAVATMGGPMGGSPSSMDHGGMTGQPGMGGMRMGEALGPDPGLRLIIYLGMWTAMMAAMMLPAAAPMILMFGTVYRTKRERGGAFVPTWVFVAGYLTVWVGIGVCAWAVGDLSEGLVHDQATFSGIGR